MTLTDLPGITKRLRRVPTRENSLVARKRPPIAASANRPKVCDEEELE